MHLNNANSSVRYANLDKMASSSLPNLQFNECYLSMKSVVLHKHRLHTHKLFFSDLKRQENLKKIGTSIYLFQDGLLLLFLKIFFFHFEGFVQKFKFCRVCLKMNFRAFFIGFPSKHFRKGRGEV